MGTLYQRYADFYYPQIKQNLPADPEKLKKLDEAVEFLDQFLFNCKYAAGENITIANYALIASFSTIVASEFDYSRFSNINRWYELCWDTLPDIEINNEGVEALKGYVKIFKEKA